MCLYPKLVKNPKYKENKKNGGKIPPVTDPRVLYIPVGCQHCLECRKQKAREWQVRLQEDIKTNTNAKFITLTFSNENITNLITNPKKIKALQHLHKLEGYIKDNAIATTATRLFLERYRKEHKKSLRHWLVTELGHTGTENIHLHGIIWTSQPLTEIEQLWSYGYVWKGKNKVNKRTGEIKTINYVNAKTVNYIVKYITKKDERHKSYKSIILTSPGIGKNYTTSYNATKNSYTGSNTDETYRTETGHRISLPIYYRNKIYTDEQKERLWLDKLDKNTRWICGEPIDVSNGHDDYLKQLKYYQQLNRQLGYGDGKKTWEQVQYEKERRELMYQSRIKEPHPTQENKFLPINKYTTKHSIQFREDELKAIQREMNNPYKRKTDEI